MSASEIATFFTAAGAFLTSLGTLISSLRNAGKISANSDKLDAVHDATTQLATTTKTDAFAAGQKDSLDFIARAASELQTPPPSHQTLGEAVAADRAQNK